MTSSASRAALDEAIAQVLARALVRELRAEDEGRPVAGLDDACARVEGLRVADRGDQGGAAA